MYLKFKYFVIVRVEAIYSFIYPVNNKGMHIKEAALT